MTRRFLVYACVLTMMSVYAEKMYAWGQPPSPYLSLDPYVCVGCSTEVSACLSKDPDYCNWGNCNGCATQLCSNCESIFFINGIRRFDWDLDGNGTFESSESPGDATAYTAPHYTPGSYSVSVRVWDHDSCWWNLGGDKFAIGSAGFTVVKVDKLVKQGTTDEGPLYVCLNGTVDLQAKIYPLGASFPVYHPNWTIESQPDGANASLSYTWGATTTLRWLDVPGEYVVKATCGTSSDTITVTVVAVDWIQYLDPDTGYTNINFSLYVRKGTNVSFKSTPNPSGASWPSGKPVWGGTSGASGTGSTKEVTFNTLSSSTSDYKTVTAECGNTVTVNVIVFDFEGVFTPEDNFSGRYTMYYGIEEKVELDFETDPWSVPGNQIGGLEWTRLTGPGTLSNINVDYGTADYDAGATDGTVWLFLKIKSGPSKGSYQGYQKDIVLPSGGYMIQKPGTGVRHIVDTCSAGFLGISYITPKNVSFTNLQTREGTCNGTGYGFYSYLNGWPHSAGTWNGVDDGNIDTGCKEDYPQDEIWSGAKGPPYSTGDFTWPIPIEYKADDGVVHTLTASQNQYWEADVNGKCTISKYGAGPFPKNASDPTSGW